MTNQNNHSLKTIFIFFILLFTITSCFKDRPTTEFSKVAGSWRINEVVIEMYDSLGNLIDEKNFEERGYFMLNFNESSLAENSFAYSINLDDADFNSSSLIAYNIGLCDRWDVAVNASHINFGYVDPNTNFSTQIIALSIEKLNANNMHWMKIERNYNGSIARKEVFKLKRSN